MLLNTLTVTHRKQSRPKLLSHSKHCSALTHLRFLSTCSWCQHIILLGLKPKPVQRRNIICKADGCQNMWDQSQCFWGWPCQIPKAQRTESSGLKGLKIGALNDKIWDIFWITRVYRCGLRPLDPSVDIVLCLLPSGDQAARYMMFEGMSPKEFLGLPSHIKNGLKYMIKMAPVLWIQILVINRMRCCSLSH